MRQADFKDIKAEGRRSANMFASEDEVAVIVQASELTIEGSLRIGSAVVSVPLTARKA